MMTDFFFVGESLYNNGTYYFSVTHRLICVKLNKLSILTKVWFILFNKLKLCVT